MVSMPGANAFERKFQEFLQEPEAQDVIRSDQREEMDLMKKCDDMEKLEELQGQREQLAVALQARSVAEMPRCRAEACLTSRSRPPEARQPPKSSPPAAPGISAIREQAAPRIWRKQRAGARRDAFP